MADPDKKKPDLSDFFAKFADRNPFEYAKAAKESEKFITPSRAEKNDKIEKLWSEFKELQSRVDKHNKLMRDGKSEPTDSDFSYKEIHKKMCICIDSIIDLDPDNYEALWNRTSLLDDKGEYEEALKCAEKITNYIKPDDVDAWFGKANLLKILERYPEALDCMDKILKIKPELERDVLNNKGIFLGQSGDEKGALNCFELAFTKPGTVEDHNLWMNKGTAFDGMNEPAKAIECYEKALELKPDNEFALYNKAMSLHHLKEYPKAVKFFDQAGAAVAKHRTGNIGEWNFLVMIFRRKGETLFASHPQDQNGTQSALQCFDYGLEAIANTETFVQPSPHPELIPLLFGKGMATEYLNVEKQDKLDVIRAALACFAEVVNLEPDWGLAWLQLGTAVVELAALGTTLTRTLENTKNEFDIQDAFEASWNTFVTFFKKALEFPDSLEKGQIDFCKAVIKISETVKFDDPETIKKMLYEKLKKNRPDLEDPADK